MPDIYSLGPWASLFLVIGMLSGLIAGIAGNEGIVIVSNLLVLVSIIVTLLGRNHALQWRLADVMLVIIGLSAFSSAFLPHWQPEELPLWGMSLFQVIVGLLVIFELKVFYKP